MDIYTVAYTVEVNGRTAGAFREYGDALEWAERYCEQNPVTGGCITHLVIKVWNADVPIIRTHVYG